MQTEDDIRELLKGTFTLDIKNFKKYNPGKTGKFIALYNGWHNDLRVRSWPPGTKLLYILLLNLRGTSEQPISNLTTTSLQHWCNLRGTSVQPSLVRLWNDGFIFLEKNRGDKIREEKKEPIPKDEKIEQEKAPSLPTKTEEISSSPQAGEALFSFEEIPKRILEQYQVSARGIETWVSKWGIEKVSANLVPASHKFEIQANTKNPHFRENFIRYFDNWMNNSEAKATGAKKKKEVEKAQTAEREKWTAY